MASNTVKKNSAAGSKKSAASKKSGTAVSKAKKPASKKNTAAAGVKQTKESPAVRYEAANPMLLREAALWLVLAVCILLFISYFGIGGYIGEVICDISFGIFGFSAYFFPFLAFLASAFLISNKGSQIAGLKCTCSLVLYICLCSFSALFAGQHESIYGLGELYAMSAAQKNGGGVVGGSICQVLCPAVGAIGAGIVLAILVIICLVLITQKSLMKGMKNQSARVYQNARESSVRRKEAHELQRRQREEWIQLEKIEAPVHQPPKGRSAAPIHRMEREPVMAERVVPDPIKRKVTDRTCLPEEMEGCAKSAAAVPGKSTRTQIEVPNVFSANKREPRGEYRRVSGVTSDTRIQKPSFVSPISSDTGQALPKETHRTDDCDTCFISLEEPGMQESEMPQLHMPKLHMPDFPIHGIEEEQPIPEPEPAVQASPKPVIELEELDASDFPDIPVQPDPMPPVEEETPAVGTVTRKIGRSYEEDIFRSDSADEAPSSAGTTFRENAEKKGNTPQAGTDEKAPSSVPKKNPRSSQQEIQEGIASVEAEMEKNARIIKPEYVFPPLALLKRGKNSAKNGQEQEIRKTAAKLEQTLNSFGVHVTVTNVSRGPSVTRYELQPEQGVKVSRIVALSDDIKLNLAAADIRIEAPIPGKAAVGIEVPNSENSMVALRDLLESDEFQKHPSKLAFATGKDIAGKTVVSDIAKMPHLLVAGATGSGKSVCMNTIIMSILYKAHPDEVKLIMIDPKVVELSVYNGIPHLFIPVVTDPKKAAGALNWAVAEMTDRYNKFAEYGVRDLKGYNKKIEALADIEDEEKPGKLPQIVIIVDELADLMMVAPGEVEDAICRLAQLARACGIHLIIATQRPSVNVITGLIKANMPSRIAFSVSSGVDSRTILDMNGAEKLLGKGDMLFYPQGYTKPARVQGAFVSDEEVADVVDFLKNKNTDVSYNKEMEEQIAKVQQAVSAAKGSEDVDALFTDAGRFIIEKDKASIGMLQRVFKIGFNRAARIMDQLSEAGVVGAEEGTKPRKILMSQEQFENYLEGNG